MHGFSRSVATFLPVRATGAGWPISKAQLSRSRLIKFMSVYVYLCVFCLSNLLNLKVTCTITRRNKSLGLEVRLFITLFCVSVAFSLIINHPICYTILPLLCSTSCLLRLVSLASVKSFSKLPIHCGTCWTWGFITSTNLPLSGRRGLGYNACKAYGIFSNWQSSGEPLPDGGMVAGCSLSHDSQIWWFGGS